MRNKTMNNPTRRQYGRIGSAKQRSTGKRLGQRLRHSIFGVALLLRLAVPSGAFDARTQTLIPAKAAPPEVQITEVKAHTAEGKTRTEIEIRWTAQVPRLTTIDNFEVLLEVRYSDGSKRSTRTKHLKPSARAALLRLANHPRQNSAAILKEFKAAVRVRFRIPSSSPVAQQAQFTRSGSIELRRAQRPESETDASFINAEGEQ